MPGARSTTKAFDLRVDAPEFVPRSMSTQQWNEEVSEDGISEDELEELEMVDSWLNLQVELEEEEKDHLVMLALKYDAEGVGNLQRNFAPKQHRRKHQAAAQRA